MVSAPVPKPIRSHPARVQFLARSLLCIFLKVWWCEAKKEYGKYPHGYHFVGGIRTRSMSWAADSDVICKLVGGLNKDNTIKRFKNYRKKLEYDIQARLGEVGQDEDLDDEDDEEDDHSQ